MHSARVLRLAAALPLAAALIAGSTTVSMAVTRQGVQQTQLDVAFGQAYDAGHDALRPSALPTAPVVRSAQTRMWMVQQGPGWRLVRKMPDSGAVLGMVRPGSHVDAMWSQDHDGHHYLVVQWRDKGLAFIEDDAHAWIPKLEGTTPMRLWDAKAQVREKPGRGTVLATIGRRHTLGFGRQVVAGGQTYRQTAVGIGGSRIGYVEVTPAWHPRDWRPAPSRSRMTVSLGSNVRHASRGGRSYNGEWCSHRLVEFGRELQRRGFRVSEHPDFGGVHAHHSRTGGHHQGCAIDVNRYPRTSAREQRALWPVVREARALGLRTIFMSPKYGHYDHAHINVLPGYWPSRAIRYGTPRR